MQFDALHVIELLVTVTATLLVFIAKSREKANESKFAEIEKDAEKAKTEIDRRFDKVERNEEVCVKEIRAVADRLNAEEKATIRQDGEIRLVQQNHHALISDLDEIKSHMVTKVEWIATDKRLDQIANQLERIVPGRYATYPSKEQPRVPTPYPSRDRDKPDR